MKRKMPLTERPVLTYKNFIKRVHAYCWEGISNEWLKSRLQACDKQSERYSILKEMIFRCKGLRLFDSQIAAACAMERGEIAELPTGEGKTLAAAVTAASLALQGRTVHIFGFNDYLVKRDFEYNRDIFDLCGLSGGLILQSSRVSDRKKAYGKKILYVTAKEAGFDYLRNFTAQKKEDLLDHSFDAAIVDEADSILIDEAGTPLVIAGQKREKNRALERVGEIAGALSGEDMEIGKENQVWLTETGIEHVEKLLGIDNLYETENTEYLALIHVILEAELFYKKDRDYIIKDGKVRVIDQHTGRVSENKKFPDFLHRAIERKEDLAAGEETILFNVMPLPFFLLKYKTLSGMTGTARAAGKELSSMYGLKVRRIASHCPCRRIDHEDRIFLTDRLWKKAVIQKIEEVQKRGQPILVGTGSVEESQQFVALLMKKGLKCCVLNAKEDDREAELIARAGEPYRITISTNMAGRGVDIILGGKTAQDSDFVRGTGGLFILGTGMNRSRRIDDQLRGRAGRQGDPGESLFFISREQELIKQCGQRYRDVDEKTSVRRIQRIIEGADAQARYILEKYSVILEKQRQMISDYRETVLKTPEGVDFLKRKAPKLYEQKLAEAGRRGVVSAQKQLLLYYINEHWADYLLAMETVRDGIHLAILGRENPIDVYQRFAVKAFSDMEKHIETDVLSKLKACRITEKGIDLQQEGLIQATSTQTYMIDESKGQFAGMPVFLRSK